MDSIKSKKPFSFRRKGSDEDRQSRFQRAIPQSQSPSSSPTKVSIATQKGHTESTTTTTRSISRISAFLRPQNNSNHSRKKGPTDPGPIGLNVLYTPGCAYKAEIVFIHGLGGASHRTWTKHENPDLFWPLKFLPFEPDICMARILTFGYNANFHTAGNVSTSVLDFAKDLLFDLKYAKDEQDKDLNTGNVSKYYASVFEMYLILARGTSSVRGS